MEFLLNISDVNLYGIVPQTYFTPFAVSVYVCCVYARARACACERVSKCVYMGLCLCPCVTKWVRGFDSDSVFGCL